MKTLKIVVERSEDMFSAYAENAKGIYGDGDTVQEAKQFILDAIQIITEEFSPDNISSVLKEDYTIIYHFDAESVLNYYKGIFTHTALEKITGIVRQFVANFIQLI